MTSILLWIYMFGWKSLIAVPLWIVGILLLIEMLKNFWAAVGVTIIFGVIPSLIFVLMAYGGNAMGIKLSYAFPVVYIAYVRGAYKLITSRCTE